MKIIYIRLTLTHPSPSPSAIKVRGSASFKVNSSLLSPCTTNNRYHGDYTEGWHGPQWVSGFKLNPSHTCEKQFKSTNCSCFIKDFFSEIFVAVSAINSLYISAKLKLNYCAAEIFLFFAIWSLNCLNQHLPQNTSSILVTSILFKTCLKSYIAGTSSIMVSRWS